MLSFVQHPRMHSSQPLCPFPSTQSLVVSLSTSPLPPLSMLRAPLCILIAETLRSPIAWSACPGLHASQIAAKAQLTKGRTQQGKLYCALVPWAPQILFLSSALVCVLCHSQHGDCRRSQHGDCVLCHSLHGKEQVLNLVPWLRLSSPSPLG